MTNQEQSETYRDSFDTVYKIHHADKYGFGGDTSIWVAVLDETEDEIIGRKVSPMHPRPGSEITVLKENVAAWEEDSLQYKRIPEEEPTPTPTQVKKAYVAGNIDEDELDREMEDALND